tara:strand:+ start:477 stop:776 length:300 start_codon:yes stop_codon:yes gene_type:complete
MKWFNILKSGKKPFPFSVIKNYILDQLYDMESGDVKYMNQLIEEYPKYHKEKKHSTFTNWWKHRGPSFYRNYMPRIARNAGDFMVTSDSSSKQVKVERK